MIALFALLYAITLDNGLRPGELEGGDLITHQYAQVQARFSNAPGYPLYTMGGWLWFRLGRLLGGAGANPIPILASYSTLGALLALCLLYVLILEIIKKPGFSEKPGFGGAWPIAFLVTAFYGVTYFFWYYAVTTEQYTSSVAWTLAAVLVALRWERTQRDRHLLALALLIGIGLAHQITVLAVIPPILWLVLSRQPGVLRRGRLLLGILGLVLLPLLSYGYVYVRGAQHPEWRGAGQWESTWQWFWAFVSTAQGRGELTWSLRPLFTAEFPALIWREMTWPGLLAGLVGWLALGRRQAILFYATLVIYVGFCWIDRLGNWYQVIMPIYALLAVGIAAAVNACVDIQEHPERSEHGFWATVQDGTASAEHPERSGRAVPATQSKGWSGVLRAAVIVLLLALIGYRGVVSYPRADSSDRPDDTALAPAWAILADDPPYGTRVLGVQPENLALEYVTGIWGRRTDLTALTTAEARAHLGGAGFAVTEAALPLVAAEISPDVRYSALGRTLIAVRTEPNRTVPPGLAPWTHDYAGQVQLIGGKLKKDPNTGGQLVFLAWQAPAPPPEDWSVSVRLMRGDAVIAQFDRQHPVSGAYPMTRWAAGEVVADAYCFCSISVGPVDGVSIVLYRRTEDGSFVNLDSAYFEVNR